MSLTGLLRIQESVILECLIKLWLFALSRIYVNGSEACSVKYEQFSEWMVQKCMSQLKLDMSHGK